MNNIVVTTENTVDVIAELEQAFWDIPFENSNFQNEVFVIANQITPERAYRAIGLRMHSKLRALQEAQFGKQLQEVELDELRSKLDDPNVNEFDKRRAQININKILAGENWTNKLVNDALQELNALYKHFLALPKFTREQFENGEKEHFTQSLQRQANGISGATESLTNMELDIKFIEKYEAEIAKLPNYTTEDLNGMVKNIQLALLTKE